MNNFIELLRELRQWRFIILLMMCQQPVNVVIHIDMSCAPSPYHAAQQAMPGRIYT